MPAVNFDRMLQACLVNGAAPNSVAYWSRPLDWKNQTLTPNPDTIYLQPFYDTRRGPVGLEIPPAGADGVIVGSVDDAWQNALEDVGPAGVDQGKGGKYVITPPGFTGTVPPGCIELRSATFQGFALLRSNFRSRRDSDIAAAVGYGRKIRMYQLGAGPDATNFVDMHGRMFDATIPYDWRFYESLHRFVQVEPWLMRDRVMIDILKSIGIEKGSPFEPDQAMKEVFLKAMSEARRIIDARYAQLFVPAFFEGTHWAVPASKAAVEGMSTSFADPDAYPVVDRAVMYTMGYFSARHLGAGQFYLMTTQDRSGRPLDGARTYRLVVPARAPVQQYWSATAYDRETHALIRATERSSRASNSADVRTNADGSVELWFSPKAPAGKEANWVPTNGRGFEVLFRLYGPEKTFFDKQWVLPDLEESMSNL